LGDFDFDGGDLSDFFFLFGTTLSFVVAGAVERLVGAETGAGGVVVIGVVTGLGVTRPGLGVTPPGLGVTRPGLGVTPPGLGGVTVSTAVCVSTTTGKDISLDAPRGRTATATAAAAAVTNTAAATMETTTRSRRFMTHAHKKCTGTVPCKNSSR
jgi:hypothetical protein